MYRPLLVRESSNRIYMAWQVSRMHLESRNNTQWVNHKKKAKAKGVLTQEQET